MSSRYRFFSGDENTEVLGGGPRGRVEQGVGELWWGPAGWCAWGQGVCMGLVAGGSEADRFVWLQLLLGVLARLQVGLSSPAPLPRPPDRLCTPSLLCMEVS